MDFSYKGLVKHYKKGNVLPKNDNAYDNAIDNKNAWYLFYREYFTNIIVNLFEWKNLPDSIDPIFLEKSLNLYGFVGFFYDKEKGFIVQNGTLSNDLDLYNNPINFEVVSPSAYLLDKTRFKINNYIDDLDKSRAFIISNNAFRSSTFHWIDLYCVKLANIEHTIQLARNALKVPYIILTDEENKLSVKNFYQKVNTGEPVIFLKDNKNKDGLLDYNLLDKISILNTNYDPKLLKDLYDEKMRVFNQFLNFLGISTNNVEKRERLITDELNADDGLIATSLESKLKARHKSIDLINKCFNLNIEVNISPSIEINNLKMIDDELEDISEVDLLEDD